MNGFIAEWIIGKKEEGMLLREYLRVEKQISKRALAQIKFAGGSIFVNGENETVRKILSEGDVIKVVFPPEQPSSSIIKEKIPLDIVFEDHHFLVINKPPQMPTIPSREHPAGSLANAVLSYYEEQNIASTFHAVNRLDKDTSGLLIIAKHRFSHDLMTKQQRLGKINREYIAIVHGHLEKEKGTINAPIGRKEGSIIEREVRADGQEAITHYRVIKHIENNTVVSIQLETGRTHQIRVHFSKIGHPLLGDEIYGGQRTLITRQALHSYKCSFFHPFEKKALTFTIDLPNDMKIWL